MDFRHGFSVIPRLWGMPYRVRSALFIVALLVPALFITALFIPTQSEASETRYLDGELQPTESAGRYAYQAWPSDTEADAMESNRNDKSKSHGDADVREGTYRLEIVDAEGEPLATLESDSSTFDFTAIASDIDLHPGSAMFEEALLAATREGGRLTLRTQTDDGAQFETYYSGGQRFRQSEYTEDGEFVRERAWQADGELRRLTEPVEIDGYGTGLKMVEYSGDPENFGSTVYTVIESGADDPDERPLNGYNDVPKHYKLETRERNGELVERVESVDHILQGLYVSERLWDGTLTRFHYVDGEPDGHFTRTRDGEIVGEGDYALGQRVGDWNALNERGEREIAHYTDAGELDGERRLVNEDSGELILVEHYRDGVREGLAIEYAEDGSEASRGNYREGKRDGLWSLFDDREHWRGRYAMGEASGRWENIDDEGYLLSLIIYAEEGEPAELYLFAEDGALESGSFQTWVDGVKHEKSIEYENGRPVHEYRYVDGELIKDRAL